MSPSSPVCRTCLGIISDGKIGYNIDEENGLIKNVRNIREMLMFCVPEMTKENLELFSPSRKKVAQQFVKNVCREWMQFADFSERHPQLSPLQDVYISVNPSICDTCLPILVNVYNYKIRCLRVESAIRSYITANNVMEGSCVDLSNVVRQQILDALKQKNWPSNVIQEYVAKVDKCLEMSRKKANVSQEVFNTMSKNFNPNSLSRAVSSNVARPTFGTAESLENRMYIPPGVTITALEMDARMDARMDVSPLNLSGRNSDLHLDGAVHVRPHEQLLLNGLQNISPKPYLTVSRNLMPEPHESSSGRPQFNNFSPVSSTSTTSGPPDKNLPAVDSFQRSFLNTFNLISRSDVGREEAVLVCPKQRPKRGTKLSISKRLKKPPSATNSTTANSSNVKEIFNTVLDAKTGILSQVKVKQIKQMGSKPVRKYAGPKSQRKAKNVTEIDNVIILDDQASGTAKKDVDEELIMNFEESPSLMQEETLTLDKSLKSSDMSNPQIDKPMTQNQPNFTKKVIVKLPPLDKEIVKRKLSSADIIEEIESKRRKLSVKLNPNLPYLHTKKKLTVKIKNDRFFKCTFCTFATVDRKIRKNHYRECHKICKLCHFKCDKRIVLDQHINRAHSTDFKKALNLSKEDKVQLDCHLCNFVGLSVFDLSDHRVRIHIKCNLSGMYKCPFKSCNHEDALAYKVARHMDVKHDGVRRRQCPMCYYNAASNSALKNHVQSHCLRGFGLICPLCGTCCKTSFSLERHRENRHADAEGLDGAGMVYAPSTPGEDPELITDEDGRITLNRRSASALPTRTPDTVAVNSEELFTLDQRSLSEILCSPSFGEIPERENDCTIVNETAAKANNPKPRKRGVILNKHNRKKHTSTSSDDREDCMIITEEIMTVDVSDDDSVPESASKKRKIDESSKSSDVIEILDEDCILENSTGERPVVETSRGLNESQTDTCSEAAVAEKRSCRETDSTSRPSSASDAPREPIVQTTTNANASEETTQSAPKSPVPNDELNVEEPSSESQDSSSSKSNNVLQHVGGNEVSTSNADLNENVESESNKSSHSEASKDVNTPNATEPMKNTESIAIACSESVLIESSDDDSDDGGIRQSPAEKTRIDTFDTVASTAQEIHEDRDKERDNLGKNTNKTSSKVNEESSKESSITTKKIISDIIQDFDDNISLTDSLPENSEHIQPTGGELIEDPLIIVSLTKCPNIDNTNVNKGSVISENANAVPMPVQELNEKEEEKGAGEGLLKQLLTVNKTKLSPNKSKPRKNTESTEIICLESVLIESSDEESADIEIHQKLAAETNRDEDDVLLKESNEKDIEIVRNTAHENTEGNFGNNVKETSLKVIMSPGSPKSIINNVSIRKPGECPVAPDNESLEITEELSQIAVDPSKELPKNCIAQDSETKTSGHIQETTEIELTQQDTVTNASNTAKEVEYPNRHDASANQEDGKSESNRGDEHLSSENTVSLLVVDETLAVDEIEAPKHPSMSLDTNKVNLDHESNNLPGSFMLSQDLPIEDCDKSKIPELVRNTGATAVLSSESVTIECSNVENTDAILQKSNIQEEGNENDSLSRVSMEKQPEMVAVIANPHKTDKEHNVSGNDITGTCPGEDENRASSSETGNVENSETPTNLFDISSQSSVVNNTIQDDHDKIISDSEPENSEEVVEKLIEADLTEVAPEIFLDKVAGSDVESDNIDSINGSAADSKISDATDERKELLSSNIVPLVEVGEDKTEDKVESFVTDNASNTDFTGKNDSNGGENSEMKSSESNHGTNAIELDEDVEKNLDSVPDSRVIENSNATDTVVLLANIPNATEKNCSVANLDTESIEPENEVIRS